MPVDVGRIGVWSPSWVWKGTAGQETAAELDEMGFGALWLGAAEGDLELVESLLDVTGRMVLATGIVNVWTEATDSVAASYQRVAARYASRLLLGIGAGHKDPVERTTGQSYVRPYERVAGYLDELDAAVPPVPAGQRVLAALGPRMLGLAAQRTAGAHPYLVTPEHTYRAREVLGAEPMLAPEQKVVLEPDPASARETARGAVSRYLALPNYTNNLLRLGYTEADFADGGSDRLIDGVVAWGGMDAVVARVNEHHQAGADHVCLQVVTPEGHDPRESFRALAAALLD